MNCTCCLVTAILAALVAGCGSSTQQTDGGPDSKTSSTPFADECTAAFGQPVDVATDKIGQTVVLEGWLDPVSPVKVAPAACKGLGGLAGLILKTKAPKPDNEYVELHNKSGSEIFCGCPSAQDKECHDLPGGARVRVRGVLEDNPQKNPTYGCYQIPCFIMVPQASCIINGCDEDGQCQGVHCNKDARQCRALPGAECVQEVGCEPKDAQIYACAKINTSTTCRPIGDGSAGSVCGVSSDCDSTKCQPACECVEHICTAVMGP